MDAWKKKAINGRFFLATDDHEKKHFVFLDGLRGVAALLVAWLHAGRLFSLSHRPAHAYLAVDFFFCLSGFVIAYAYDEKLDGNMNFSDFALKRLIRLYPMIICGVLLGGGRLSFWKSWRGRPGFWYHRRLPCVAARWVAASRPSLSGQ